MTRTNAAMDLPPRIGDEGEESPQPWQDGFELVTASGGMTCNVCGCLVRQVPGRPKTSRLAQTPRRGQDLVLHRAAHTAGMV
jgi:hypothetical protein